MDARNDCEHNIFWKVGNGNLSFWWDNWTNRGALAGLIECDNHPKSIKVSDFIAHNQWNTGKLHEYLPSDFVTHILSIWTSDHTGSFSTKSAWNALRQTNNFSLTNSKICHNKLPFKVSFHMLRILNNKLATDDSLTRFGMHGPSKCYCCHDGRNEDSNHLFSYSQVARKVWNFFENALGLICDNTDSIHIKLMRWWLTKSPNKVHELIFQCLPSVIFWEIWKYRCTYKYEGTRPSSSSIMHKTTYLIQLVLTSQFPSLQTHSNFRNICLMMDNIKPKLDIIPVWWSRPNLGDFKLNVDGCSKGNPGSVGGGGILRNHLGHMIMAFTTYLVTLLIIWLRLGLSKLV
ncbi:hypothetical protein KY289_007890 [Solanum tuberosum]|nr:hypothetical protein KY289_007890 [Solanum tuberosum]